VIRQNSIQREALSNQQHSSLPKTAFFVHFELGVTMLHKSRSVWMEFWTNDTPVPPRSWPYKRLGEKSVLVAQSQCVSEALPQRIIDAQRHAQASPFNGKPPVEVLDISSGWDSIAKFDVVIRRLKRLKLYDRGLVFCPAAWDRIEQLGLERYGEGNKKEKPHIECGTEAAIRDPHADQNLPREMCEFHPPALIVFHGEMLRREESFRYYPIGSLKDLRDAVAIIFLLTSDDF